MEEADFRMQQELEEERMYRTGSTLRELLRCALAGTSPALRPALERDADFLASELGLPKDWRK